MSRAAERALFRGAEVWGGRCLLPVQGGGEGRCHFTSPNPPAFSLIKPVLLISGNERNLEVKLSSYAS